MGAARYGGGESLLQVSGRAQLESEIAERVQSGHDQTELGHVGKGEGRAGEPGAAARRGRYLDLDMLIG